MLKVLSHVLVPIAAFVIGIFLFFNLTNQGASEATVMVMDDATLPVVYLVKGGERINELHGYTVEMESTSMRDTITPVESGGELPVSVDTYGESISSISYQVRSLDGQNLVQESEAEDISVEGDTVTATLPIQNLLDEGTEYQLILKVEGSAAPCWFYTRIIEDDESYIDESIAFVKRFHDMTMEKTSQKTLANYMEPEAGADNTTLQTVTINNSLSQAEWGDFVGIEETDPMVSIKELNDSYNVILLTYVLSSETDDGETSYFNVEEYYRVRYGMEKMYLLSFERTVEEIFEGNSSAISSDALVLGIRSSDVDFMANETGNVACFVQQGELWSYNADINHLTRVYSFRTEGETDVRENYNEHDIRIIRIAETGSIDFIVYGYMNRGSHEGQVGISICHYDSANTTVEERMFIPSRDSYQMLKAKIGSEMYISDSGLFYLVMGDAVYCVNLNTSEDSVEVSDMAEGNYAGSDDGRYLAWTEGDAGEATVLHLMDLETGRTCEVEAPGGYIIRPLGFMDSDCIYGLASKQDLEKDPSIFPMKKVVITDFSSSELNILKTYTADECFVTGITVENGNIYLHRTAYLLGKYEEMEDDIIYNQDMQEMETVYVSEIYSEPRQTEVVLHLASGVKEDPDLVISGEIISDDVTVDLFNEDTGMVYYVYAKGKVIMGTNDIAQAVISADENRGVVIGPNQTYVWKRAKAASGTAVLGEDSGDGTVSGDVYDLTGCTLDQVLYYVGIGLPVYSEMNSMEVIVTAYDSANVTLYEPALELEWTSSIEDASDEFAADGNRFSVTVGW
ncbi:MAG: hypothetical protein LUC41_05780 [Clostridiales bacterium]|nr:hypothetical protein [Clostridiales bacterium]